MKPVQDTDTDRIFLQLQRELLRMGLAEGTGGQPVRRLLRGQGFCMELPEDFRETDRDRAAALFYSRHRPETMVLCPKRCAGCAWNITMQRCGGSAPAWRKRSWRRKALGE